MLGVFGIEGVGAPVRKAVVDDMLRREQHIVGAGDRMDDATVERVELDRVFLMTPRGLLELKLEFAAAPGGASPAVTNEPAAGASGTTNRFGCVQTQENRWQFSRKPLLDYYQELLDEPERMVAVFDTMKPVRDERNKITGYVVGVEGEADFFQAVGLRQGDIVRKVNSLPMTNRRRAEAMIDQFLKEQMSVVVLDVERDGKPCKQIYQLAP
jgi:type II secretory pathway component PulC